jgi:hypothetical protein
VTDDFWSPPKTALDRVPADPPATETLARRARSLRTRRYAVAGLALLVVGVGILVPVGLLSRLGTQPEQNQIRPGGPIQTPPVTEESAAPLQTPTVTEESGSPVPEVSADPYAPELAEAIVEVAKGTAFGQPWTLSAYWSGPGTERSLCLQLTGAGGGCGAPTGTGPYPDSTFHARYGSFSTAPSSTSFTYGVVSKDVRGVTAILDDGRVLSVETIRTKKFPVSFYVIAFQGETQVAGVEALDAEGKVLDESSYRP